MFKRFTESKTSNFSSRMYNTYDTCNKKFINNLNNIYFYQTLIIRKNLFQSNEDRKKYSIISFLS